MISTKELFDSLTRLSIKKEEDKLIKIISKDDALKFKLFFVNNKPNIPLYLKYSIEFKLLHRFYLIKMDYIDDQSWYLYKNIFNGVVNYYNEYEESEYSKHSFTKGTIFKMLDVYEKLTGNKNVKQYKGKQNYEH